MPLYDQLLRAHAEPVVALNRAVAVAEVDGPAAALALVDALDLAELPPLPRRSAPTCCAGSGRAAEAAPAYDAAIARCGNAREREFLALRRRELGPMATRR